MRTKTEIINELNQTQTLCNRLIMDIGQGYTRSYMTNNKALIAIVNQKIDAFKTAEAHLQSLEQELANSPE